MRVGMRSFLKSVVERNDTAPGRAFDLVVQILILFSLTAFAIETLPGLTDTQRRMLDLSEAVVVFLFTVEYLLRVFVADRALRYVLSLMGLIDLLAILPFYLAVGLDLRSLRAVRLLRLVRIFRLERYSEALARVALGFRLAREEIVLFLTVSGIIIYVASVGIYYFERDAQPDEFASVFHALWWAIVTLTTVGYGDVYPVTVGGKIFTGLVLVVGLGFVAGPAAIFASALAEARRRAGEVVPEETTETSEL